MKILCVDVGNTSTKIGVFLDGKLVKRVRFVTERKRSEDEFVVTLSSLLKEDDIDTIVYSSVVPSVNEVLKTALIKCFNPKEVLSLSGKIKTGLPLKVDNPSEVGADLIAAMVGLKEKYDKPAILVDIGTATKILLLDKEGFFSSAVIMPGLSISAESLFQKGEQLPSISLEIPRKIVARNTFDAMNVGIVYGHIDAIEGIIRRLEKEIGYPCRHFITGGGAFTLLNCFETPFTYDENICLEGLYCIYLKNKGAK